MAGVSEVLRGFEWNGLAATHLLIGSMQGVGSVEIAGRSVILRPKDLVLCPAGAARCLVAQSDQWKFFSLRLTNVEARWRLPRQGPQSLPAPWFARILAPIEGMLAEDPAGGDAWRSTHTSQGAETALGYLMSRHSDRLVPPGPAPHTRMAPPDTFGLHATILSRHVQAMLASQVGSELDETEVALATLWSRVVDRPRGPWDAQSLAASLGVSRTSLFRMVKRQHGRSPARVVESLRMEASCSLLRASSQSIESIARDVGYANAFSFSAAFKRVVGKPPSIYRQAAAMDVAPDLSAAPPSATTGKYARMPQGSADPSPGSTPAHRTNEVRSA